MRHLLFKVKTGKQNDWRSWCEYLCLHNTEAKRTMCEENCVYERSLMFEREGEYYVLGTSLFVGEPKKANLDIEINARHKEMREECLSKSIAIFDGEFLLPTTYEILYEFDLR